jgi:hypothetical protein
VTNDAQRVNWRDDAQTIITVDLSLAPDRSAITLHERMAPLHDAARLAGTVTHPVALIADLTAARIAPPGNWLTAFRQFYDALPPNVNAVVIVGSRYKPLIQHTISLITAIWSVQVSVAFVATLDDAIALLTTAN